MTQTRLCGPFSLLADSRVLLFAGESARRWRPGQSLAAHSLVGWSLPHLGTNHTLVKKQG